MQIDNNIISSFVSHLDNDRVLIGEMLSDRYDHIWKMDEGTNAQVVLLPKSTEEISNILKICNREKIPVVIHGGLTNLVGSTETFKNDVVISLERMNNIIELDEDLSLIHI